MNELVSPLDIGKLVQKKYALLKKAAKRDGKPINIGVVGGYNTNELCEWLSIFSSASGMKTKVSMSAWGSMVQLLAGNYGIDDESHDLLLLLPGDNELLFADPLSHFKDNIGVIESVLPAYYENAKRNRKHVIQCLYAPPLLLHENISTSPEVFSMVEENNNALIRIGKLYENVTICCSNSLANRVGLLNWYDKRNWYAFGQQLSIDASIYFAKFIAAHINAIYASPKKLIIVDLDNTLWGGVVGDDGINALKVGPDTAEGRPYYEFQRYLKILKDSGVVLAISSKNQEEIAKSAFELPGMHLQLKDFSSIRINWNTKGSSIADICKELNLGLESAIFIDDNPVEREEVKRSLPMVSVPDIGDDATEYIEIIDSNYYFLKSHASTAEDARRSEMYNENKAREAYKERVGDHDEFLKSLGTKIFIEKLNSNNIDRIVQLFNKTNQFNLNTIRLSKPEMIELAAQKDIHVWGISAKDKFGDYGLISAVMAKSQPDALEIQNWVMSCRVFNRRIEHAIFESLVGFCKTHGYQAMNASVTENDKNKVIHDLLPQFSFSLTDKAKMNEPGKKYYQLLTQHASINADHFCEVTYE